MLFWYFLFLQTLYFIIRQRNSSIFPTETLFSLEQVRKRRNRRTRRLEIPSPKKTNETKLETPNSGNKTLTNVNFENQENLRENNLSSQLTEPCLINNEMQVSSQILEHKNNDRNGKVREEVEDKFETILKAMRFNKSTSTLTNLRCGLNETQNVQPTGSKTEMSLRVHASVGENTDAEDGNYPLRASEIRSLRHPVKPMFRNNKILMRQYLRMKTPTKTIVTTK